MVKAIMERHILLAEQIKTLLQIQRKLIGHQALILQTWFISKWSTVNQWTYEAVLHQQHVSRMTFCKKMHIYRTYRRANK